MIPLALVCAFRVARSRERWADRWYELALAGAAVAGFGLAQAAYRIIHVAGGYTQLPLDTRLVPVSVIFGHNLPTAGQGLLLLPGADFLGLAARRRHPLRRAAPGRGRGGGGRRSGSRGWRFGLPGCLTRSPGLTSQLLAAGIVINFAAFVATAHVFTVASAREIAPVLPFAAALAGRELGPYLGVPGASAAARLRRAGVAALGLALAGYLAGLGLELTGPAAPPQDAQLTAWLESHPIGTGLSGYWEANVVTLASGGRVAVRPVTIAGDGGSCPPGVEVRAELVQPGPFPGRLRGAVPRHQRVPRVRRSAGGARHLREARAGSTRSGQYTILWWPKNLLADLPSWPAADRFGAGR